MRRRIGIVDDTGQVSSWIVKLILGVAIGGFLLLEVGAVVINRVQASDVASQAAQEAGFAYSRRAGLEEAENIAQEYVERHDAEFVEIFLGDQEEEIFVRIRKTASTRLVHRIDALEDLITIEVTESAPIRD